MRAPTRARFCDREGGMKEEKDSLLQEEREIVAGESEILHDLGKGIVAGVAGTVAVAILIFLQGAVGFLPEVSFITLLGNLVGGGSAIMGWLVLFALGGLVGGIAFAALDGHVGHVTGAGEIVHGILFAVLLWAVLMLILMPIYMTEAYVVSFAIAMFVGLLVYGIVMGAVYGAMNPEEASN
jgi:uncharacterized protein DUF6789